MNYSLFKSFFVVIATIAFSSTALAYQCIDLLSGEVLRGLLKETIWTTAPHQQNLRSDQVVPIEGGSARINKQGNVVISDARGHRTLDKPTEADGAMIHAKEITALGKDELMVIYSRLSRDEVNSPREEFGIFIYDTKTGAEKYQRLYKDDIDYMLESISEAIGHVEKNYKGKVSETLKKNLILAMVLKEHNEYPNKTFLKVDNEKGQILLYQIGIESSTVTTNSRSHLRVGTLFHESNVMVFDLRTGDFIKEHKMSKKEVFGEEEVNSGSIAKGISLSPQIAQKGKPILRLESNFRNKFVKNEGTKSIEELVIRDYSSFPAKVLYTFSKIEGEILDAKVSEDQKTIAVLSKSESGKRTATLMKLEKGKEPQVIETSQLNVSFSWVNFTTSEGRTVFIIGGAENLIYKTLD